MNRPPDTHAAHPPDQGERAASSSTSFERRIPRSGRLVKLIASLVADILVAPLVLACHVSTSVLKDRRDTVFQGFSQLVSMWPGFTGSFLRRAFYRRTLRSCSTDCHIAFGTIFATPEVDIGRHVYIGPRCMIAHCVIHDDALLGSNVDIVAGAETHYFDRTDIPVRLQGGRHRKLSIGRDSWIGNGATVLADVGDHAIVAAGAVVVKSVEPRSIVGGNPAREISRRPSQPPEPT
jgi:virginiamycin A acetyltransferase